MKIELYLRYVVYQMFHQKEWAEIVEVFAPYSFNLIVRTFAKQLYLSVSYNNMFFLH